MIKRLLCHIERLPLPLTARFHFPTEGYEFPDFEGLGSPALWDQLRRDHPYFSLPGNRGSWIEMCESAADKDGIDGRLGDRAADIIEQLQLQGIDSLFSAGSGNAALEYHIKKQCPALQVVCSDHAPQTVATLRTVFTECDDVVEFDLLARDWERAHGEHRVVMINRVDPLFTNRQWKAIFRNAHQAEVTKILFIPAWILTLSTLWALKRRRLMWRLRRVPVIFTGWIRTMTTVERFWRPLYDQQLFRVNNSPAFLLTRRPAGPASLPEESVCSRTW